MAATAGGAGDRTDDRTDDRTGDKKDDEDDNRDDDKKDDNDGDGDGDDGDGDDGDDDDEDEEEEEEIQILVCRKEWLSFHRGASFRDVKEFLIEHWGLDAFFADMTLRRTEVFRRVFALEDWETIDDCDHHMMFVEWMSATIQQVSHTGTLAT